MMTVALLLGGLLLLIGAAGGGWWWQRQRATQLRLARQKAVIEADQRQIFDLLPGDVVEVDGLSLLIEASLLYDEQGSRWAEHRAMQDLHGQDRWLSVADDDRVEIALDEVLPAGAVAATWPPPTTLQVGRAHFELQEAGNARVRKRDKFGLRDHGRCDYADYLEDGQRDGARLSLERWGETIEVAIGHPKHLDDLMILPGSSS